MSFRNYINEDWVEFLSDNSCYLLPVVLLAFGLIIILRLSRSKYHLPPGPTGLPLVGYFPFLGNEPHKTLDNLRKKYGNVFGLYLGPSYVVILADYTAVKEAFSKPTMNDRPLTMFDGFMPDGTGVGGINGEAWVAQRRFVVRSMKDIGLGRSRWARLVEDEVLDLINEIADKKGRPTEIHELLSSSITNNISSLIFGERLPPGPDRNQLESGLDTLIRFFSSASFWNLFPWMRDMLVKLKIGSLYEIYSELVAFNEAIKKQISLHKNPESHIGGANFVSDYITAMQTSQEKEKGFSERNLIGNTRTLYGAGSETTTTSVTWLFLTMAAYPDVQEKVHSELDRVLGKQGKALFEDRMKFPYIYAIILETQRWKTIVPLNLHRMASEDTQIFGYDIPKGTTIIANIWGLHNDSKYWSESEKFIPERFLEDGLKEIDLKKESFLPFSYGKRRCPGETVALMAIFLYFTAVMQLFSIRVPGGGKPSMEGRLGVTYSSLPQKLCFIPRQMTQENI